MALGNPLDLTNQYKTNIYQIQLDVSGWDKVCVQVVAPVASPIYIYGSNDPNALHGVRDGNATLATNFMAIQATNLASGAAVSNIAAAGLFSVPVNAQFLRLSGGGADVYRLLLFESKVS